MDFLSQNYILRYLVVISWLSMFLINTEGVAVWRSIIVAVLLGDRPNQTYDWENLPVEDSPAPEQEEETEQNKKGNEKEEQKEKEEKKDKRALSCWLMRLGNADESARSASRFLVDFAIPDSIVREVLAPPPERN